MSAEEIAKDLTLAIVDKLLPTNRTNDETMNSSLAEEVAKAYTIIYQAVKAAHRENEISLGNMKITMSE